MKIVTFVRDVLYRPQNRHIPAERHRSVQFKTLKHKLCFFCSTSCYCTKTRPTWNNFDINYVFKRPQPLHYCSRRRELSSPIKSNDYLKEMSCGMEAFSPHKELCNVLLKKKKLYDYSYALDITNNIVLIRIA